MQHTQASFCPRLSSFLSASLRSYSSAPWQLLLLLLALNHFSSEHPGYHFLTNCIIPSYPLPASSTPPPHQRRDVLRPLHLDSRRSRASLDMPEQNREEKGNLAIALASLSALQNPEAIGYISTHRSQLGTWRLRLRRC